MKALNLAGRPFRNERLAATAFMAAALGLIALSAWHAVVIRNLLPARTSERHQEVAALEAEASRLGAEERALLKIETPAAPTVAEWSLVKDLVDRRAFSWTGLFARLEQLLPEGVRLKSVSPSVVKGQVEIDVDAAVRSRESGWEFVRVLEAGGDFYGVYPKSETGNEFSYTLRYRPQRPAGAAGSPAAAPSPSPAPESGEVADADAPPPSPSTEARR